MHDIAELEGWAPGQHRAGFTGSKAEWIDAYAGRLSVAYPSDRAAEVAVQAEAAGQTQGEFDPILIALLDHQLAPLQEPV